MRFFLLLIPVLYSFSSISQSYGKISTQNIFDNIKKETIELKLKTDTGTTNLSFSNIIFIDKRYDTSAIGYLRYDNPSKEFYKLITKNNLSYNLEEFVNSIYKNKFTPNNASLVIAIRKFWFDKDYDFTSGNLLSNLPTTYFLTIGFDCYYFLNNEYIPLIKKDTLIEILQKRKASEKGIFVGESLKNVLNNLFSSLQLDVLLKRKKLTYQELSDYYNKRFHEAIFTDEQLKKGVYMSFNEFKKNSPSITNFDIRKTKLADDIYILDGKDAVPSREAWGYSDGVNLFIKLGTNLFQLYRQGNSYSFLGNDKLTHRVGYYGHSYNDMQSPGANLGADAIGGLLFSKDKFKLELIPLQLNMETGGIF